MISKTIGYNGVHDIFRQTQMGEIRIIHRHKNSNDAFYVRMSYELSDLFFLETMSMIVYVANKVRLTE